jgi:hypothetical protein
MMAQQAEWENIMRVNVFAPINVAVRFSPMICVAPDVHLRSCSYPACSKVI